MSRGLAFLHLADSHIGVDLPARPRNERLRRGDEIVAGYRRGLAPALRGEVDLVIHAGDLFDRPRPSQAALAAAITPLLDVAAQGVPVVIVPGNHERCVLPESLLLAHRNLHVVGGPATLRLCLRGTRVAVAAVPCIRKRAAAEFHNALRATEWPRARADVNILAVHQTFESARCGPAGYRFRSGEDVVEREVVPAGFDYVAAGHIHRHQVLASPHAGGPPIVYAGSTERITFAERDEPKGVVLVEADGGRLTHRFLPHRVRPMVVVSMDVSGRLREEIRAEAHRLVMDLPLGACALLRMTGAAGAETLRGLDLARSLRATRPDVLLKLAMRQVRIVPGNAGGGAVTRAGARRVPALFEPLGATAGRVREFAIGRRQELPRTFGTYACLDAERRLLYVGKAQNVRSRIAAHLRGGAAGGFYEGWPRRIARVVVRVAACDLEALLVEAEMIRRYRPPFNRQLRSWQRYCYLQAAPGGWGTLEVAEVPPRGGACFGPYRSRMSAERVALAAAAFWQTAQCPDGEVPRDGGLFAGQHAGRLCQRYYDGLCAGPCAGRIEPEKYAARLAQRDALLRGGEDSARTQAQVAAAGGDATHSPEMLETLRNAFDHGVLLRRAAALLGCRLVMPACCGSRTAIRLTGRGLHLEALPAAADCDGVVAAAPARKHGDKLPAAPLPRDVMDVLGRAARALQRRETSPGDQASQLAASSSAAMPRC